MMRAITEGERHLLVVPGLVEAKTDLSRLDETVRKMFVPYDFSVSTDKVGWNNSSFDEGLDRIGRRVEEARRKCDYVSIMGASAGGVAAVAALDAFSDLTASVSVSAPLNPGVSEEPEGAGLKDLRRRFPAFSQAIDRVSSLTASRLPARAGDIMTLKPWADDLFFFRVAELPNAKNIKVAYVANNHNDGVGHILRNPEVMRETAIFIRGREKH